MAAFATTLPGWKICKSEKFLYWRLEEDGKVNRNKVSIDKRRLCKGAEAI